MRQREELPVMIRIWKHLMQRHAASPWLTSGWVLLVALAVMVSGGSERAVADPKAAPFQAEPLTPGTLRIWGQTTMSAVVSYWTEGFLRFHPEIRIEQRLMGSATAVPGLYAGLADIALLGRENDVTDDNGFGRVKTYQPQRFELMTGSLDVAGKTPALAVLVHRDNSLTQITLTQLAGIAGCGEVEGRPAVRTWGQLGAKGTLAQKPIRLYMQDAQSGTSLFFLKRVLGGSRKLNWDQVVDFKDIRRADGSTYRAAEQIADALAADPSGIAVGNLRYAGPDVKALAIAESDGAPAVLPARDTVIARTYPLARSTYAFVDQKPGQPLDPKVREFLRYTLSLEGQADVTRDRGYLPLSDELRSAQSARLK